MARTSPDKWSTTREERVAMLREWGDGTDGELQINGLWLTMVTEGTEAARDEFLACADEAGFELMLDLTLRRKP